MQIHLEISSKTQLWTRSVRSLDSNSSTAHVRTYSSLHKLRSTQRKIHGTYVGNIYYGPSWLPLPPLGKSKKYEKMKKIIYKSVYTPIGISPSGRENEWKGNSCRIYWWSSSTLRRKVKPSIFPVIGSSRCHRIKLKYSDGVSRSTLTCFIFVLWSASVPAPPRTARAQSALEKQPSSRDPPERWWW